MSDGSDSITCRDIRYKGEDTRAYRFIERGSGASGDQTASFADVKAAATTDELIGQKQQQITEQHTLAALEELIDQQPRSIIGRHQPADADPPQVVSSQQPVLSQPVVMEQVLFSKPAAAQQSGQSQPITTEIWDRSQSQPITAQQYGLSQPIMTRDSYQSQPVTALQSGQSQPITTEEWDRSQSQPITAQQYGLSQPIMTRASYQSQPVTAQRSGQSQPITTEEWDRFQSQPIIAQQYGLSQPIMTRASYQSQPVTVQQSGLTQPVTTEEWDRSQSQPITAQQYRLSQPIMTRDSYQSQLVTAQQSGLSQPVTTAEWDRSQSQPITAQQYGLSQPINTPDVFPLQPVASHLGKTASSSPQPVMMWQPVTQAIPFLQLESFRPMTEQLPTFSQPISLQHRELANNAMPQSVMTSTMHATSNQPPYNSASNSYPVSPPSNQTGGNTPPFLPHPSGITDLMSHPPPSIEYATSVLPIRVPHQPLVFCRPSYQNPPRPPVFVSPTPGIRCRSPASGTIQFMPPSQWNPVEYFNAGNGKVLPSFAEDASGNRLPSSSNLNPHSPQFCPASASPEKWDPKPASVYVPREFDNWEDGDGGGPGYAGGSERYDQEFCLRPADINPLPNMWPSAQPVPIQAWPPSSRYIYVSQNSGFENPPMMYHVAAGGQPWDFQGNRVDYAARGFSMPVEIPVSVVLSSSTNPTAGFSNNQSGISLTPSPKISQHSHAEVLPTFQQSDRSVSSPKTENPNAKPQSCERTETTKYHTFAGTFHRGKYLSLLLPGN